MIRFLTILLLAFCVSQPALSAAPTIQTNLMSTAQQTSVIDGIESTLRKNYIFPEKIDTIMLHLRMQPYGDTLNEEQFAREISDRLVKASGDLHFMVGTDRAWISDIKDQDNPEKKASLESAELASQRAANFGFKDVRILEGNVGYVRFDYFAQPDFAYQTVTSSMHIVENADALIIDLRYNSGGHLETAQLLMSYLFGSERDKKLFDYYYNQDGKRVERAQWVLPALPGPRMPDIPVYILTGSTSFSAAEWMAFSLQSLGRAEVIGAVTAGAAHPVDRIPIDDVFFLQTPIGEIRGPAGQGDFEGVGVQPDIAVASSTALTVAHLAALDYLGKANTKIAWQVPLVKARAKPVVLSAAQIECVTGQYEGRDIRLEDGTLIYRWRDRFELALMPLSADLFAIEGVDEFRYRLETRQGKVVGISRVMQTGESIFYGRK
ncbi:MAG: S41 family peptidase [Pontixanthobacter sp.]